jgi:hypothetical protein
MSSVTFQLDDPTATDEPAVWITLTENMDGTLTIKTEVQGQPTGDLRGLFFDVTNEALISKLVFTSTSDMTTSRTGNDDITAVGSPSNNMSGRTLEGGGFDVGIEIGSQGIGDDDIQTFSVTLSTSDNSNLTLADFALAEFGVRIMSVGTGENREGSNKLIGSVPAPLVGGPPPILLTQALSNLVLYLKDGDGEVFKVKLEAAGEEIYTISRAALQESISDQYGSDTEWLGLSIHAGNEYKNDAKWDGTANGEGVFFLLDDATPIRAVGTKAGKGWTYDWSVDDFDNMSNAPSAQAQAEDITAALLQQQATVTFSASDWM